MLYGISQKGMMFLIAHSPEKFEIAGSFQLPLDGRMPAFAHPVICDGKLYLRQGPSLSVYNIRNPKR
ncbi:MAG: hypothetical protein J7M40_09485 [Planctomycetes bacterium]|nr:hypothetical protein [Planctomycetota bacterium]